MEQLPYYHTILEFQMKALNLSVETTYIITTHLQPSAVVIFVFYIYIVIFKLNSSRWIYVIKLQLAMQFFSVCQF